MDTTSKRPPISDIAHLHTVDEVAYLFHVATKTIYNWSSLGKLTGTKVNGRLMFNGADLADKIAAGRRPERQPAVPAPAVVVDIAARRARARSVKIEENMCDTACSQLKKEA